MKRTKEWWSRLTKEERSYLVALEAADHISGRSDYLPDDCRECGYCGTPHLGTGLCHACAEDLVSLLSKADGKEPEKVRT